MAWWFFGRQRKPEPAPPQPVLRVRRDVVELICESARGFHPNEFGGILRAEKGIVSELLLLPGTTSGATHAQFQLHMLPIDFSVVGTVHSHPSGVPMPSGADLELFRRFGRRHIIIGSPYNERSWRAYDGLGNQIRAEVVDG